MNLAVQLEQYWAGSINYSVKKGQGVHIKRGFGEFPTKMRENEVSIEWHAILFVLHNVSSCNKPVLIFEKVVIFYNVGLIRIFIFKIL